MSTPLCRKDALPTHCGRGAEDGVKEAVAREPQGPRVQQAVLGFRPRVGTGLLLGPPAQQLAAREHQWAAESCCLSTDLSGPVAGPQRVADPPPATTRPRGHSRPSATLSTRHKAQDWEGHGVGHREAAGARPPPAWGRGGLSGAGAPPRSLREGNHTRRPPGIPVTEHHKQPEGMILLKGSGEPPLRRLMTRSFIY